jgi:pantetheine-phosphate adenylyltransferase
VTVAVFPASFDPISCGHVDIATRAAQLFDRLIVAVYAYPKKNVMFSLQERVTMVQDSLAGLDGVEVTSFEGLAVDLARSVEAQVLVRGLRTVADFESEYQQAALNRKMLPGLDVVSLFASDTFAAVSSSMIKEIAENGGDVSFLVPPPVMAKLSKRFPR